MYDTLLFLHILGVFALVAGIVMESAFVLGGPYNRRTLGVSGILTAVGGSAALVFGIWLAIYVKGYELWDGWILGALILFLAAMGISSIPEKALKEAAGDEPAGASIPSRAAMIHWLAVTLVVLILVLMIWKPGA